MIFLLCTIGIVFVGWLTYLLAAFTQSCLEFVLPFLVHHVVHIPLLLAWVLNIVCNGFALTFDIVVEVIRIAMG